MPTAVRGHCELRRRKYAPNRLESRIRIRDWDRRPELVTRELELSGLDIESRTVDTLEVLAEALGSASWTVVLSGNKVSVSSASKRCTRPASIAELIGSIERALDERAEQA